MSKSKKSPKKDTPEKQPDPTTQEQTAEPTIRILYHGTCPKLTARGVGLLDHELGLDDGTGQGFLRITGACGGIYSNEWLSLDKIRKELEDKSKDLETFRANILKGVFSTKSTNNHGYLGAILKSFGILKSMPKEHALLSKGSWEPIFEKIDKLKAQDISLTDHIAILADKKAKLKVKKKKIKEKAATSSDPIPED